MKKLIKLALVAMLIIAAGSFSNTATAQVVYVSVRPAWHPVVRPAPPSIRHVWVDEEWDVREGRYVAVGGYWALPPHPGMVWIPGHWAHEQRGDYWIHGHWANH